MWTCIHNYVFFNDINACRFFVFTISLLFLRFWKKYYFILNNPTKFELIWCDVMLSKSVALYLNLIELNWIEVLNSVLQSSLEWCFVLCQVWITEYGSRLCHLLSTVSYIEWLKRAMITLSYNNFPVTVLNILHSHSSHNSHF